MDDPKLCPFCPGAPVTVAIGMRWVGDVRRPTQSVTCPECGTQGPWRGTREEAVSAWNTRTPDPRLEEVRGILRGAKGVMGGAMQRAATYAEIIDRAYDTLAAIERRPI